MKRCIPCLLTWLLALATTAQGVTLLSADIPPYSSSETANEGLCIDIARALFRRAGIDLDVEFHPWARSQRMAITGSGYVITPLTRTPEREPHYDWVVPIYSYKLLMVTNDPLVRIKNIDAMRQEEICVLRESPAEYKLRTLGFGNRMTVTEESTCMQMLALKRAKVALIHGSLNARYGYKKFGYDPAELIEGTTFPSGDIYIGSTKGALSPQQHRRLNQALETIQRNGLYESIIDKYR